MASTSEMRAAWGPACDSDAMTTIDLGDNGARVTVAKPTVEIWRAVEAIFAKHSYPIRKADTGAYNCRPITGGTGYSLHAYGIAVDVNWQSNPYGPNLVTDMPPAAIRDIEALNVDGVPVVRWGGRYSGSKDAMHFEVVVPPSTAVKFTYESEGLTVAEVEQIINTVQAQGKLTRTLIRNLYKSEAKRDRNLSEAEVDEIVDAIEKDG